MPSGVYTRTPDQYKTRRGVPSKQKGCKRTPEQRKRIGEAHIGQVAWNKGKKGIPSPLKGIPTGRTPWNKGQSLPSVLKERISRTLKDKKDKLTPHSIYYLIDPVTLIPRYVGFSERPKRRFDGHITHLRGSTHKVAWIKSLLDTGLRPILSIRCIVASKLEACRIETALIALLRARGVDLTNATPGGEGGATMTGRKRVGKPWTAERRAEQAARYAALPQEEKDRRTKATRDGWKRRDGKPTKKYGKGWSEKQRVAIVAGLNKPEVIARQREHRLGKPVSQALIDGVNKAWAEGKHAYRSTPEYKVKMKEAMQRRYERHPPDSQVSPLERLQRQIARNQKKLAKLVAQLAEENNGTD